MHKYEADNIKDLYIDKYVDLPEIPQPAAPPVLIEDIDLIEKDTSGLTLIDLMSSSE